MDFPVFHLDTLNNRVLIAVIAIVHVVINHGMAVGGIPLVSYLEHRGLREPELGWDRAAWRLLKLFFIITTTVGALTGVGIWLSAGLVNPMAIGSLIRVFFWTWFVEWLVFVTEVVLILAYYLTWTRWLGPLKRRHARLGVVLAVASWVTMALIVSILSFMMDPGSWSSDRTLLSGMLNPVYLPQLAFRTPLAMVMAGAFGLAASPWLAPRGSELRARLVAVAGRWVLAWLPLLLLGGWWYARAVPDAMRANVTTALLTQALAGWARTAHWVLVGAVAAIALIAAFAAARPVAARRLVIVPALLSIGLVGAFERVREYIRKPWAIPGYLYSNGYRADDYPLLQRDGLLARATYTELRTITPANQRAAGRQVFVLACTRCHTVDGINGIRGAVHGLYGDAPWSADALDAYIGAMHNVRTFMPPFPGSPEERRALATYLVSLQDRTDTFAGAQRDGVVAPPR